MCEGKGVWRYEIDNGMGRRWKERRRRKRCGYTDSVCWASMKRYLTSERLPFSHVHCSSVVNQVLSPAAVLKLCPPGVAMVISSGVVMEKGARCNKVAI